MCVLAVLGAAHALFSSAIVWALGGGFQVSEFAAKRVGLCGGALLWWVHIVSPARRDASTLPLTLADMQAALSGPPAGWLDWLD